MQQIVDMQNSKVNTANGYERACTCINIACSWTLINNLIISLVFPYLIPIQFIFVDYFFIVSSFLEFLLTFRCGSPTVNSVAVNRLRCQLYCCLKMNCYLLLLLIGQRAHSQCQLRIATIIIMIYANALKARVVCIMRQHSKPGNKLCP